MNEDPRPLEDLAAEAARSVAPEGEQEEGDAIIPEDAFYSPDDPIAVAEGDIPDDAIYSPDEPILREDTEEGVVTDMGGSTAQRLQATGLAYEIRKTARILEILGRDLEEHGMEALRIHPETDPMEAMLRSFVAGYLVGQEEPED
jgi:hypothetical protein